MWTLRVNRSQPGECNLESKDSLERLDQLQIAKSDDLDKNFTRGFERSRTGFLLPHIWLKRGEEYPAKCQTFWTNFQGSITSTPLIICQIKNKKQKIGIHPESTYRKICWKILRVKFKSCLSLSEGLETCLHFSKMEIHPPQKKQTF